MTKDLKGLSGSGAVATYFGVPRWQLLYLIEQSFVPGPSLQVPGRRLFTPDDVKQIGVALRARSELRRASNPITRADAVSE